MFERITINPKQMGGVPCIRGLRIPVATVVGMVADGMSRDEIVDAYPDLEADDIREALQFAAHAVGERGWRHSHSHASPEGWINVQVYPRRLPRREDRTA